MSDRRREHWDEVYQAKEETEVSWFQQDASLSLALIRGLGLRKNARIVDIGGGASRLVDGLLREGYGNLAVLDLSAAALERSKARLGDAARRVDWIVADVTQWETTEQIDLWHDRAAFHFLVSAAEQQAYVARMRACVPPGGAAIIATFALDGPQKCSGLDVARYSPETLSQRIGPAFALQDARLVEHHTPWGARQHFQFSLFRRTADHG